MRRSLIGRHCRDRSRRERRDRDGGSGPGVRDDARGEINRGDFDLTVASAYNSELVKQKLKIMRALNLKVVTGRHAADADGSVPPDQAAAERDVVPVLAVDRNSTNLAILRNAVNKHCNGLADLTSVAVWR